MEKQRGGFTFFRSFKDATKGLPDKDRLALYDAIINKALDDEDVALEGILNNIFAGIKPHLEAGLKDYKNGQKGAIHGKKGGRPKSSKDPPSNPGGFIKENPEKNPNENVNDNVDVNGKDKDNTAGDAATFPQSSSDPEQSVLQAWNGFCDKYPVFAKVQGLSSKRRELLKARLTQPTFKDFNKLLEAIESQTFLHGKGGQGWKLTFDWLIENDSNHLKVLEHKYADWSGNGGKKTTPQTNYEFSN